MENGYTSFTSIEDHWCGVSSSPDLFGKNLDYGSDCTQLSQQPSTTVRTIKSQGNESIGEDSIKMDIDQILDNFKDDESMFSYDEKVESILLTRKIDDSPVEMEINENFGLFSPTNSNYPWDLELRKNLNYADQPYEVKYHSKMYRSNSQGDGFGNKIDSNNNSISISPFCMVDPNVIQPHIGVEKEKPCEQPFKKRMVKPYHARKRCSNKSGGYLPSSVLGTDGPSSSQESAEQIFSDSSKDQLVTPSRVKSSQGNDDYRANGSDCLKRVPCKKRTETEELVTPNGDTKNIKKKRTARKKRLSFSNTSCENPTVTPSKVHVVKFRQSNVLSDALTKINCMNKGIICQSVNGNKEENLAMMTGSKKSCFEAQSEFDNKENIAPLSSQDSDFSFGSISADYNFDPFYSLTESFDDLSSLYPSELLQVGGTSSEVSGSRVTENKKLAAAIYENLAKAPRKKAVKSANTHPRMCTRALSKSEPLMDLEYYWNESY